MNEPRRNPISRRQVLRWGAWAGASGALAVGARVAVLPPPATKLQRSRDELARQIFAGIQDEDRARVCLPYDHPLRQFHNRGLGMGGVPVSAFSLGWQQRRALTDLVDTTLSPAGRERILSQLPSMVSGVNFLYLLMFGDPHTGPWQMVLSSVHMNLRLGGADRDGVAFGGAQVYGDQRGNEQAGLPGNRFRHQMQAAHEFIAALTPAQRKAIRVAQAPAQTCVGVQGNSGSFDGLAIAELAPQARRLAGRVVGSILETYSEEDAEHAWDCLRRNGGVEQLHFADYDIDFQGGRRAGDRPSQIFRLEGPAAVFHFRGEPHLHAFINIAMDGEKPLSVGEELGTNPQMLHGDALRRYYESAMREQGQADFAHYPGYSVVGRLRTGPVRSGDIWVAESWGDELVVCELKGRDIAPQLAKAMTARGSPPQSASTYRIATAGYVANTDVAVRIGRVTRRSSGGRLRDAFVAHARGHGFTLTA